MEIDPERWYWPSTPVWCEGVDQGHVTVAGETPVVREMGHVYCSVCAELLPEPTDEDEPGTVLDATETIITPTLNDSWFDVEEDDCVEGQCTC